ncbi:hypothetical protein BH11PLA1_BH11PLA1_03930 [soil metagenome]
MPEAPANPPSLPVLSAPAAARAHNSSASTGAPGTEVPEPTSIKILRWFTRGSVVACVLSLIVHVVLGFIGYQYHIRFSSGAAATGGTVEVATMSESQLAALEDAELNSIAPGVDDTRPSNPDTTPAIELPGGAGMENTGDIGALGDGLGGAGAGTGIGLGDGAGGAGGGTARFFGMEARGSRFAYVVDISGSMMDGGKIEALRKELATSIDALPEGTQFCVMLFSSVSRPLMKRDSWFTATSKNKNEAIKLIEDIHAEGGTEPLTAFTAIFSKLRPRPDAIYFLTDGQFDSEDGNRIISMSRNAGRVAIHSLTFVSRDGEMIMRRIARETGGNYTHVTAPKP